jgi:hypothetical protein
MRRIAAGADSIVRYLGGMAGSGVLRCDGKDVARADYEFDGFLKPRIGVVGCGEIETAADALLKLFGRSDVQLLTDEGLLLDLMFSDKSAETSMGRAHVDITSGLSSKSPIWRH